MTLRRAVTLLGIEDDPLAVKLRKEFKMALTTHKHPCLHHRRHGTTRQTCAAVVPDTEQGHCASKRHVRSFVESNRRA